MINHLANELKLRRLDYPFWIAKGTVEISIQHLPNMNRNSVFFSL